LEAMGIGRSVGPSDCRPSERMRWTIASKTHPAKLELSGALRKRSYVSQRCLSSPNHINSTTSFAIRADLKLISQLSSSSSSSSSTGDGTGYMGYLSFSIALACHHLVLGRKRTPLYTSRGAKPNSSVALRTKISRALSTKACGWPVSLTVFSS